ncbi:MAG: hypothetical protein AB8I08_38875 [Sandaracinaceae bacterium]
MNGLFHEGSLEASLDELKAVYRVIEDHHEQYPELEDNSFLASLRELLEDAATADGVDIEDDDAWAAWLRDADEELATSPGKVLLN